jgi:hypothetical protein
MRKIVLGTLTALLIVGVSALPSWGNGKHHVVHIQPAPKRY